MFPCSVWHSDVIGFSHSDRITVNGQGTIHVRRATPNDIGLLRHWDNQPHIIQSDPNSDWDWEVELHRYPGWREQLIFELESNPFALVQVIDPAEEDSHYWGNIGYGYRAVDIWIGEKSLLNKGYGSIILGWVTDRCFADPEVNCILVDPLAENTAAHRFYQRLGFKPVERRRFDQDECLVHALLRPVIVSESRNSSRAE